MSSKRVTAVTASKWARRQLEDHTCQCEDCRAARALLESIQRAGLEGAYDVVEVGDAL